MPYIPAPRIDYSALAKNIQADDGSPISGAFNLFVHGLTQGVPKIMLLFFTAGIGFGLGRLFNRILRSYGKHADVGLTLGLPSTVVGGNH